MWFHLFGLITIASVQSLTISYPYSRWLLSYNSNQLTVQQGFLIYLDNVAITRTVSYSNAQPLYAIQQLNTIKSRTPVYQTIVPPGSSEIYKYREAHFRAWSLHQYQVLKREIDFLREEGKEPSAQMILKFIPLEKIALTSDYSAIAELPDVKRLREEHLNIWNQVLHMEGSRKAALAHSKTNIPQLLFGDNSVQNQLNFNKTLDEGKFFEPVARFPNRNTKTLVGDSFESNTKNNSEMKDTVNKYIKNSLDQLIDQIAKAPSEQKMFSKEGKEDPHINSLLEENVLGKQLLQIRNIPEEVTARDLLLQPKKQIYEPTPMHSEMEKLISKAPAIYVPKQVADAVEVVRAQDEHLKIINEAILKAKQLAPKYYFRRNEK